MPLVETKYDNKVNRLRDRLKDDPNNPRRVRNKLQKFKTKQYFAQERNAPPPPTPWSAKYETTMGNLTNNLNQTQAQLAGQRLSTEQQFGITDRSNPFSSASLLQRSHQQQQARTLNSYAGRGQLYSGAMSRARSADQFGYGQQTDELLRAYQAALGDLSSQELGAQREFDEGSAAAEAQRLEDALNTPVDPSEAPGKPQFARQYIKGQQQRASKVKQQGKQRAQRLRKAGKEQKAKKVRKRTKSKVENIRERLQNL